MRAAQTRTTRRRPGPQPRGGEASRRSLFAAAAREFAARGFAGASVDRIAAAARLNKAMIYYHFGSKAQLYAEILRDMFRAVGDRVREIAGSPAPPDDRIRRFVAAIAIEADARPHFPPIWFREIADGGTHLDAETIREVAGIVVALEGFIDAGVRSGAFHRVDPLLVHAGIVAPLLLFFASRPLRERIARAGVSSAVQYQHGQVVEHIQRVTLGVLRGLTAADDVCAPGSRPSAAERPGIEQGRARASGTRTGRSVSGRASRAHHARAGRGPARGRSR